MTPDDEQMLTLHMVSGCKLCHGSSVTVYDMDEYRNAERVPFQDLQEQGSHHYHCFSCGYSGWFLPKQNPDRDHRCWECGADVVVIH